MERSPYEARRLLGRIRNVSGGDEHTVDGALNLIKKWKSESDSGEPINEPERSARPTAAYVAQIQEQLSAAEARISELTPKA